jgi:hypothetical protein
MRIILKFVAALVIGFLIAGSERPIHRLEKTIAGNEGVSRWYLIMRYIIGTGALASALLIMLSDNRHFGKRLEVVFMAFMAGAVGVGSGVGLRWVFESWDELTK